MGVVIHAEERFLARRPPEPIDPVLAKIQAARQALKEKRSDNPDLRPKR